MTGKELILVLAGCGVAAGAVGVTTAVVQSTPKAPDHGAQILERLDELDRSVEKSHKVAERVERQVGRLADRVSAVERRTTELQSSAAQELPTALPLNADSPQAAAIREALAKHGLELGTTSLRDVTLGKPGELAKHVEKLKGEGLDGLAGLAGLDGELAKHLDAALGELGEIEMEGVPMGAMLGGFRKGLQLRQLPEAERWDKARQDVGLADYQIDNLRQAIAERDAAMKEAMTTDTRTTDGGATLSFSRVDPEKARGAREQYDRRVAETLNDQQRKDWREGGYDNAFGGNGPMGMGPGVVITSTSTTPGTHDVETVEIGGE